MRCASATQRANSSIGEMSWSDASTSIAASGSWSSRISAARPMHAALSRPAGSATVCAAESRGSCRRTSSACAALVITRNDSGGKEDSNRETVCWIMLPSPKMRINCLGLCRRLRGQKRVPAPPAMITG